VILMGLAIMVLFILPWLDRSRVKSIRYKGLGSKILLAVFAITFIRLGMLGMGTGTAAETMEARIWTFAYFAFFVLMPFVTKYEKTKPEPKRVSK